LILQGATILITGARRIGAELAEELATLGANVALTFHTSAEATRSLAARIIERGGRGLAIEADLTDPRQAEAAVLATTQAFGRIDALVNMASVYRRTAFDGLTADDYRDLIASNLSAPYFTSVAAARAMLTQDAQADGLRGRIVSIGDAASDRPRRGYLPYFIAKGALKTMTLAMARELAPHVAVNLIEPGTVDPPVGIEPDALQAIRRATPLDRIGRPSDVNSLVIHLLESTSFATGSCWRIDGGRFLGADEEPPPSS
jgi:pteridine reductase